MDFTFKIGSDNGGKELLPVVDRVKARLVDITPNKFNAARAQFVFRIADHEYDGGDDEDNETIQRLSQEGYTHFEGFNLPEGDEIGKRTRLYFFLKGFRGGKDIESGESIDLNSYKDKDYYLDFELTDAKGGPPDFAVKYENGKAVQKSQIGKIRPVSKAKAAAPAKPKPPVVDDDDDSDLLSDDDE